MIGHYFSRNGTLLPLQNAVIPLDNLDFSYGYGVYETLKVRNKVLYFPERHIERLFHSAKIINLNVPLSPEQTLTALQTFVAALSETAYNVKVLCVAGDLYIFASAPLFVPERLYRNGIPVITYSGERLFPQAKTLNMLMSYLAYAQAKKENAYDALLIDRHGFIREGTRTNFFFTDGEKIFTPPAEHVLEGVTKLTLTEALMAHGIPIHERSLKQEEISHCKGLFLTSTSSKVLPISKVDAQEISIPPLVREVMTIYDNYLEEYARSRI